MTNFKDYGHSRLQIKLCISLHKLFSNNREKKTLQEIKEILLFLIFHPRYTVLCENPMVAEVAK